MVVYGNSDKISNLELVPRFKQAVSALRNLESGDNPTVVVGLTHRLQTVEMTCPRTASRRLPQALVKSCLRAWVGLMADKAGQAPSHCHGEGASRGCVR